MAPVTVIILGDLTQGNRHPDLYVSDRLTDQIAIAEQALRPIYALPNLRGVHIACGTGAHNWGAAATEILIASHLQCQYPDIDMAITYHGLMDIDGAGIDYAHHGPGVGNRSWLRGNMVRFYLRDLMMREIANHRTPPKVVLRGHVHNDCYEYLQDGEYSSHCFILPSLAGLGEYAQQATRSIESITNGTLMITMDGGEVAQIKKDYHTLDLRRVETA